MYLSSPGTAICVASGTLSVPSAFGARAPSERFDALTNLAAPGFNAAPPSFVFELPALATVGVAPTVSCCAGADAAGCGELVAVACGVSLPAGDLTATLEGSVRRR